MTTDFAAIASTYDETRYGHSEILTIVKDAIRRHQGTDMTIVDVGCGTGNETSLIRELPQASMVIGVDSCLEMLSKARRKGLLLLVMADASALPFRDASVDMVFSSFLLHHLRGRELRQLFAESYRILRRGGVVLSIAAEHAQLRRKIYAPYFPDAIDAECARTPDRTEVETIYREAGFASVEATPFLYELRDRDSMVARLNGRYASQLTLLDPDEFAAGMTALKADAERFDAKGAIPEYRNTYLGWKTQ